MAKRTNSPRPTAIADAIEAFLDETFEPSTHRTVIVIEHQVSRRSIAAAVEAFLDETGMFPTTFGEEVMGDPNFVRQLREGRTVKDPTAVKILAQMAFYRHWNRFAEDAAALQQQIANAGGGYGRSQRGRAALGQQRA
jgi:hypothetical protein